MPVGTQAQSLGIFPEYIAERETVLRLDQDGFSWSGDDLAILDEHGEPFLKCRGEAFSLGAPKVITSMNGPILFKLRHKSLSLGFKFEAEDRDGEILFTLSQELSLWTNILKAVFINRSDSQRLVLEVRKGWWGNSSIRTSDGQVIAQITTAGPSCFQLCSEKPSYEVRISPGVDRALVAALCLCLREAERDWETLIFGHARCQPLSATSDTQQHHHPRDRGDDGQRHRSRRPGKPHHHDSSDTPRHEPHSHHGHHPHHDNHHSHHHHHHPPPMHHIETHQHQPPPEPVVHHEPPMDTGSHHH